MILFGFIFLFIGICLGAMTTHFIGPKVSPEKLIAVETAIRYEMYIGLAFLALAGIESKLKFSLNIPFILMLVGALLFVVPIYISAFLEMSGIIIGKSSLFVIPIGGTCLILSWLLLIIKIIKQKTTND